MCVPWVYLGLAGTKRRFIFFPTCGFGPRFGGLLSFGGHWGILEETFYVHVEEGQSASHMAGLPSVVGRLSLSRV